MSVTTKTFHIPPEPRQPRASGVPWLAMVMPVLAAGALFTFTHSPAALTLGAVGPIGVWATYLLTRRQAVRQWTRENHAFESSVHKLLDSAQAWHDRERELWLRAHPDELVIGFVARVSKARIEGSATTERGRTIRRLIEINPRMPVAAPARPELLNLGFRGTMARQIRSRLALHAAQIPAHNVRGRISDQTSKGAQETLNIELLDGQLIFNTGETFHLALDSVHELRSRAADSSLPEFESPTLQRDSLRATLGVDDLGAPVSIDLLVDGPHALIAGTTGSGKSVLLQALVLGLAERYDAASVQFLLIDFKGGTSLQGLMELPHCIELVTDLESSQVARIVAGLSSELRRREEILRANKVADIAELATATDAPLPRLVIVVDEFAALLSELPELHGVFTDVAARGRALGVHLVIATQRPTGVVRDALAANCTLRFCLRVANPLESSAVVGVDRAAWFPRREAGLCIHSMNGDLSQVWRVTAITQSRIRDVSEASATDRPKPPWKPALATSIDSTDWPVLSGARVYLGMLDLPEQQDQHAAIFDLTEQGSLLVLGARRSGKSNLCDLVAEQWNATFGEDSTRVVGNSPDSLWDALHDAFAGGGADARPRLWVFDDFDAAFAQLAPEQALQIATWLNHGLTNTDGVNGLLFTAQKVPSMLASVFSGSCARVFLKAATKEQHMAWGLPASSFSSRLSAGRGYLNETTLQVARAQQRAVRVRVKLSEIPMGETIAVVTPHPERTREQLTRLWPSSTCERLGDECPNTVDLTQTESHERRMVLGTADEWMHKIMRGLAPSSWMFTACTPGEIKQLTRTSDPPPPCQTADTALLWQKSAGFSRVTLERHQ